LNPTDPPAALRRGLEILASEGDPRTADLRARSEALTRLESIARAVAPNAPPQSTIVTALSSMRASQQAGADSKMGGQIREQMAVLRDTERKINSQFESAFGSKLANWGAELDAGNLTIRFQKEGVLFDQGSAVPKPGFKVILKEMFPAYIRILHEFKDE